MVNLGTVSTDVNGWGVGEGRAINDIGEVTGYSRTFDDSGWKYTGITAFLYSGGSMTNLGRFGTNSEGRGASQGFAVNNAGQVIGYSEVYDSSGDYKGDTGFLYSGGRLIDLGNLGRDPSGVGYSLPYGISDDGLLSAMRLTGMEILMQVARRSRLVGVNFRT